MPALQRRDCLRWAAALALPGPAHTQPGAPPITPPTGWTQPRPPAPALALQCADGKGRTLRQSLLGQVSAVQLMFTGCSGSCPVQGALFADIASRLPPAGFQLLSISIDALGDDAQALKRWQARYGAAPPPGWLAAVPSLKAVEGLREFLRGVQNTATGAHTAQVFVFDREARLAYRTGDNPQARWLEALMVQVARPG
jgi:protein SCO1/2